MATNRRKKDQVVETQEVKDVVVDTEATVQSEEVVEEVVEAVQEEEVVEAVEETTEVTDEPAEEETVAEEVTVEVEEGEKPFSQFDTKLRVHEHKIVDIPYGTKKVVVENLGGGDLYVDVAAISFSAKNLVVVGDKRGYEGIDKLFISSASRPTFRVSLFK